ncbi:MAG TPA: Pycsar system effector family protein [Puia sp.]|nr:Pycsar system effector family protein [Puia sp.]
MDYTSTLEQVRHYVRSLFETHVNENLLYHNRYHTEKVVEYAAKIGRHYQLNEADYFIVNTAAWFHDVGYLTGPAAGHEERGARMAESFLAGTGVEAGITGSIRQCILATQLPQRPAGLLDEIVCDADLFHLGTDEFSDRNKLMRREVEAVQQKKISKEQWRQGTIRLLESHHYFTEYCRQQLEGRQAEHLAKLLAKESEAGIASSSVARLVSSSTGGASVQKEEAGHKNANGSGRDTDPLTGLLHQHNEDDSSESGPAGGEPRKNKKKNPGRGIDTVFRITSNNNQRLSTQADSKAHILIQVNSIIISVLLSLLLRKIEDHTNLAVPAIILLTVNLVTIIFSILATRPHIPRGTFSKADLEEKKVNLLFFGNFYKMSLEEYAGGMLQMMDDKDFLYGSLIRDVYNQGIALGNKYRWLRLSYNVFMYGLIGSVLAFVIAALVYPAK